ncbi:DUF3768 domain-containing protein [Rhodophyticola porphyridii]|uniref:DUF3768 domain-containing protein n=2 Tax=Rhodophyticola porphyridii TaxID=1852017 RepID=A0A3L9Y3L0_9RHOB|nr:DUF3768 domain-containing protein [Rhodophyticola porphyridii]
MVPRCRSCGSERVALDAWACWNSAAGLWELEKTFDDAFCHACEDQTKLDWSRPDEAPTETIRTLNDAWRCRGEGQGQLLVTSGVQAKGSAFVVAAVKAMRAFNDFSADNDVYREHDFGAFDLNGEKLFFKIDYYDRSLSVGSDNPANPTETVRVLTLMLASEY